MGNVRRPGGLVGVARAQGEAARSHSRPECAAELPAWRASAAAFCCANLRSSCCSPATLALLNCPRPLLSYPALSVRASPPPARPTRGRALARGPAGPMHSWHYKAAAGGGRALPGRRWPRHSREQGERRPRARGARVGWTAPAAARRARAIPGWARLAAPIRHSFSTLCARPVGLVRRVQRTAQNGVHTPAGCRWWRGSELAGAGWRQAGAHYSLALPVVFLASSKQETHTTR